MSQRLLAIADMHGCLGQLERLLAAVELRASDHLVLLGDYLDRGSDSAGVLKRVMELRTTHPVTALKGNHEEMMLAARGGGDRFREWLLNGGDATLKSYGGRRATLKDVPPEHWQFLEAELVDYLETPTHIFVHANAYPDHAMDEQPEFMLRWERCDAIQPHQSGKIMVCGHTPQRDGRPMNRGFAICLDTGAGHGGPLTCMEVGSGKLWQADARGEVTKGHISEYVEE